MQAPVIGDLLAAPALPSNLQQPGAQFGVAEFRRFASERGDRVEQAAAVPCALRERQNEIIVRSMCSLVRVSQEQCHQRFTGSQQRWF